MRWLGIVALGLAILVSAGCEAEEKSVTGLVAAVTSSGIDSFSSLEITDDGGRTWKFGPGRFPAFTPSHLREHQISREKVKVTYREEGGGLVAVGIADG